MASDFGLFSEFERKLRQLVPASLSASRLLPDQFLISRDGTVSVYYAPMDAIEPNARIAIVGITPDRTTAGLALVTAHRELADGQVAETALAAAKTHASFSGFRKQLVAWLDYLEIPRLLGLRTSSQLWKSDRRLLHATSAIRYPVFVDSQNYNGSKPPLAQHKAFRPYLFNTLAPELDRLPAALVIPLGRRVDEALETLVAAGRMDSARCLKGFPHPSGQNGHKGRQWNENREQLKSQTEAWLTRSR